MNKFFRVCFIVFVLGLGLGQAQSPHNVVGRLTLENGSAPASASFSAYVVGRESDVLTQASVGCGYTSSGGIWWVQTRNFAGGWSTGEVLHVTFSESGGATGTIETTLTSDPQDDAGTTVLTNPAHEARLSVSDFSVARGTNFLLPVAMTGLGVADSVIAYELTLTFDTDVLLPLGGDAAGTMTANWGSVYATPGDGELVLGGFTTNQTATRLVADGGVLVNASFQAQGLPDSQTSETSLVRLESAVIYTLDATIVVSHTRTGAVTVTSGAAPTWRSITLQPSWNLVSLGIAPDPNTIPEIFNGLDIDYAYGYISGQGPRTWSSSRPSFLNDLLLMDGLKGYWVKSVSASAENWNVSGVAIPVDTPIPLASGWNLIGYLPSVADQIGHALTTLGTHYLQVLEYYDHAYKTWARSRPSFLNDLVNMSPTRGYWVKLDEAATLAYPTSGYSIAKPLAQDEQAVAAGPAQPQSCDFWAFQPGELTPGDSIKVYDQSGVLCGDTTVTAEGGFLLHVIGDDSQTEDDEGAEEGELLRFTVNGHEVVVKGTSENHSDVIQDEVAPVFEPMGNKRIELDLSGSSVSDASEGPEYWELLENYPNPFNGGTSILISLRQSQRISLILYDALGRMVRKILSDEKMASGTHRLFWDCRDESGQLVATGVYIAMLVRNGERVTKKILYLR